jgi:hypothetical protein
MKKTTREWLDQIQTKIHLEIDVNTQPCGWDLNNFNHSFHNEKITLDEFKDRLLNSIVECNIKEMNDWLNNSKQNVKYPCNKL